MFSGAEVSGGVHRKPVPFLIDRIAPPHHLLQNRSVEEEVEARALERWPVAPEPKAIEARLPNRKAKKGMA